MLDTDRYTGGRKLTPMLEQYVQAKAQCPDDSILMFRMGTSSELFFKDAEVAARELDLVLTAREKGSDAIPMAGVPHHAVTGYVSKLVERGFSVAICDQVEDPKQAKGLVRREITRLITPGTVSDSEGLDPSALCYLAAVAPLDDSQPQQVGVVLLDLLAGQLLWTEVARENLVDECLRFGVREVLVPSACSLIFVIRTVIGRFPLIAWPANRHLLQRRSSNVDSVIGGRLLLKTLSPH